MNNPRRTLTLRRAVGETPVISILSGKGGVGKSVLAFNLAECLAHDGHQVLLVDADLARGNLHLLGNVAAEYGLAEVASGELNLSEASLHLSNNLDLLAATRAVDYTALSAREAAELIASLRRQADRYDAIIVDHPSGADEAVAVMAHASNLNLLVVVPELTSIADAYGLYKELVTAHTGITCRLVVNWAANEVEAVYLQDKLGSMCERFLGGRPAFMTWLPQDNAVRRTVAEQAPLRTVSPTSPALEALQDMSAELARLLNLGRPSRASEPQTGINDLAEAADIRN